MNLRDTPMRIAAHVQHTAVAGEIVILDGKRGTYLGLNETGTAIWQLLVEHGNGAAAVEALQARYGVPREIAERDVDEFLAALHARQLVEPAHGVGPGR
jgi:hypothetical protein